MVRPLSFNPIPPCYIPHPHGSPPSAPLPPSPLRLAPFAVGTAVPHPRRRRGLRPPPASAPPCSSVHTTVGAATVASGRWRSLLTSFANKAASSVPHPSTPSLILQPHPSPLHPPPSRLVAFGAFAPLTTSASLRSSSAPRSRIRVAGAGFALLRLPHTPLAPVSAPLPSAPSAVTATQSPCRLRSAGFADVDSPSLIPWDLSFLTAQRGFGLHTTGSRRFGGSAALPPHRLAQSPLHLMRHRSDTGLHITIVAGGAFHVHDTADHDGTARRMPVTTPMVMAPVNLSVMTIMVRQLDRSADFTSKGLDPSLPDRATPSSPLRGVASSAAFPSPLRSLALPARSACPHPTTRREHPASRPALRHSRRVVSPPSDLHPCLPTGSCRPRRPTPGPGLRSLGVAGAAFARHRLPLPALLRCPHHCGRHCRRLRQRASDHCPQLLRQ